MYDVHVDKLTIIPFGRPFNATISPPGSKSLTNRALVLAALGEGESHISNILVADDTEVMLGGLQQLGFIVPVDRARGVTSVRGEGGRIPAPGADIYCGNSGTTVRFLTAVCTLGAGEFRLDGDRRMRERPITGLVELIERLGANIEYATRAGCAPVIVHASGLRGGRARFTAGESSQYLSAVLMAAPYAREDVVIDVEGAPTSRPYIDMTLAMMRRFGVNVRQDRDADGTSLHVPRGRYAPGDYAVEPDASAATYFMAAAAINPGSRVTIAGLGTKSLQGDVLFADILGRMGATVAITEDNITVEGGDHLTGIDCDMTDMPDAAMTLAVVALFAKGETLIRGLHTLPLKETDRLAALSTELRRLGGGAEATSDCLRVTPPDAVRPAEIETYDDHRMAMSFAVAGTRVPGITIVDPDCVRKTYPDFWIDLEKLRPSSAP